MFHLQLPAKRAAPLFGGLLARQVALPRSRAQEARQGEDEEEDDADDGADDYAVWVAAVVGVGGAVGAAVEGV